MITTRLIGGLGNQMFQYASALGIANKNNTTVGIDLSWYEEVNSSVWTMSYELDCFQLSGKIIDQKKYAVVSSNDRKWKKIFTRNAYVLYKEESLAFDPNVLSARANVILDGYWQSEKYFKHIRKDILKEFNFYQPPFGENANIAKEILSTQAVSLHVRRGDYASHAQTNSVHGLITLEYYQKAIESIAARVPNAHFFVFSDEPEWCKQNLSIKQPHTFISGNKKGCYDMQLMAMCKHHIIANSSFSWWGAWLNPKEDKIIIAPNKWFNDTSLNSSDLIPEDWERI